MDERWILLDHGTGLHVRWYFWLRVLDEVNRSARYGGPFALLLLDAEAPAGASRRALEEAASRVPAAIRSTDLGGLLAPGKVGVLLLQQDASAAQAAMGRILGRLQEHTPAGVTWSPRLLSYPEDGGEISLLLTEPAAEARQPA